MADQNQDIGEQSNRPKESDRSTARTATASAPRRASVRRAAHQSTAMLLKALTENLETANDEVMQLQVD